MPAVLSLSSVTKSFGNQIVFSDVSFEISQGEKVGLVGQNGTGKSTLLNIIYGLENRDSGELEVMRNVTVGYLTQESRLDPSKTLLEAVSIPTGQLGSLAKKIVYLEKKLEKTEGLTPEELERRITGAANPRLAKAAKIFGLTALTIGLTLIALIVYSMLFGYR